MTNVYPTVDRPYQGTFIEQQIVGLRRTGIEVETMFLNRLEKGRRVYNSIARELAARMIVFRPDVVHVMYGGVMARNVIRAKPGQPVVVSFCGEDLYGTPGYYNCLRNWINHRASYEAAVEADGIVVKSRNLRDALPSSVTGKNDKPIAIIPNGIDASRFQCHPHSACLERLRWSPTEFHVVFCNNVDSIRKRQWLAEAAVDRLVCGGRKARLHVMDRIPHAEVPFWLSAGDVLLVTSMREGSINIVKEALACNLPIVSVDVGDVAERIKGVEGCYLADPAPDDLATKLEWVAGRGERTKGRAIIEDLSVERVAERLRTFYDQVRLAWGARQAVD